MEVPPVGKRVSSAAAAVGSHCFRALAVLLALASTHCQSVQTAEDDGKAWRGAERIDSSDLGNAFSPQVAVDPSGNAIAVWDDPDTRGDLGDDIWSNRFEPANGWGEQERLEEDERGDAVDPQVAVDLDGNAIAVWRQSDGTTFNIWSNRFTPEDGWGTAAPIGPEGEGDAQGPQVAMDADGNATAVWQQSDGQRENIWSNRYDASNDWGVAQQIEDSAGRATRPQVAMDAGSTAVAVWQQSDGVRENIWSNRYTFGDGWGTQQPIETNNEGPARFPQVSMDAEGTAVAVWEQSDGERVSVWSNRYTPSTSWGNPVRVDSSSGDATVPQVAVDPAGAAVAVWQQTDGARSNIWSSRSTPGGRWGTAGPVERGQHAGARNPQVAIDVRGVAVAVWTQLDAGRDAVWSSRTLSRGAWRAAERVSAEDAGRAREAQVDVDPQGDATVVWLQFDGPSERVWSNGLE